MAVGQKWIKMVITPKKPTVLVKQCGPQAFSFWPTAILGAFLIAAKASQLSCPHRSITKQLCGSCNGMNPHLEHWLKDHTVWFLHFVELVTFICFLGAYPSFAPLRLMLASMLKSGFVLGGTRSFPTLWALATNFGECLRSDTVDHHRMMICLSDMTKLVLVKGTQI